jgi:hypothetical protein
VTRELAERFERQRDAYRALEERSPDAHTDLAYAPFSYYKERRRPPRRSPGRPTTTREKEGGRAFGPAPLFVWWAVPPGRSPGGRQRLHVFSEPRVLLFYRGNLDGARKRANGSAGVP